MNEWSSIKLSKESVDVCQLIIVVGGRMNEWFKLNWIKTILIIKMVQ